MITKIFNNKKINEAAELIKKGEVVAFPTETVYGLGADALNPKAVKKIFEAKGRPSDNPLIIHIADKKEIYFLAKNIPKNAFKLIEKFWPGPLTIILKKSEVVPYETTGGLDSVAIRMPNNKTALKLITLSKTPISAPSANISGKPSGTNFKHVLSDFNGKISGIIKSNDSQIGLESSVIDLTTNPPILLRPGGLSLEKLKKVCPNIISKPNKNHLSVSKSPGMKYRHYSPNARIILFEKGSEYKIKEYQIKFKDKKTKVINPNKIKDFAKKLFKILRKCDEDKVDIIFINSVKEIGIGLAVMNRLRKAASIIH